MALTAGGQLVPNAPMSGWKITSQVETLEADPTGRVVPGIRVYFRTAKGQEGSVFVSRNVYSVPNVQAAVAAEAHVRDLVLDLGG